MVLVILVVLRVSLCLVLWSFFFMLVIASLVSWLLLVSVAFGRPVPPAAAFSMPTPPRPGRLRLATGALRYSVNAIARSVSHNFDAQPATPPHSVQRRHPLGASHLARGQGAHGTCDAWFVRL